jgi:SMODS domain-containing protein
MNSQLSIPILFKSLLERIEPRDTEIVVFEKHKDSVTRRLERFFKTNRVELIGSYTRSSAIRHTSDIDLMLILQRAEARWGDTLKSSYAVLGNVRIQLLDRYKYTVVVRDQQAVVAQFAGGQHPVDVVPAIYLEPGPGNYPVFLIPDGSGDWMPTSPQAHNKYINGQDDVSGGKLKYVAKLIKFWCRCRRPNLPLNSFHLELLLAQQRVCVGAISYTECLAAAFSLLASRDCRALQDPLGVSGLVKAADTEAKRQRVHLAATGAARRAYEAIVAEENGKVLEAFRLWNHIFNGQFPRK